jgi:hypothetical protein
MILTQHFQDIKLKAKELYMFRIWDEKLKKFTYSSSIFNQKPYTEKSTFPQYDSCKEYHRVIVEEAINRKDNEGKDMYKGDIISGLHTIESPRYNTERGGRSLEIIAHEVKGEIIYDKLMSCYCIKVNDINTIPLFELENCKILSNIHEKE